MHGVSGDASPPHPRTATILTLGWAAALALLGVAWERSPVLGHGLALTLWTVPAGALLAWSGRVLGQVGRGLPGARAAAALGALWLLMLGAAWRQLGPEVAMDGLILREPTKELLGRVLTWLPFVCALLGGVGMLSLALEARYRLVHGP